VKYRKVFKYIMYNMSMSKRRKREADFEVEEKTEEERKTEKVTKSESEKPEGKGTKKIMFYSIVVAVVFFGIGFFFNPVLTGYSIAAPDTTETGDQFIFISPPGCTNCAGLEPLAKEVANTLGLPFMKTGFGQQIPTPGFVLIYDNVLTVSGFQDEYTLKNQVCVLTKDEDVCSQAEKLSPPEEEQPTPPAPDVPKSDVPEAHAFVMSYCPYGLQFMKAYVPVIELLGDKADLELNFVHYIMHGEKEMTENTRMHCIQKEEKAKFTDYLRCFVEFDDPEKCMSEAGIDSSAIDTCMQETDEEFEITKTFQESTERFPRYGVDAALAEQYGVSGSPTFGINGQQVQVSRSAEAIKQAICAGFNSPPEECSQTLSSAPEAPGLGPIGSGGGSGSEAQC
jgi:hypothetical protein